MPGCIEKYKKCEIYNCNLMTFKGNKIIRVIVYSQAT